MKHKFRHIYVLTGFALAFALAASSAHASWGSPACEQSSSKHCYAITNWKMENPHYVENPSESVKGGVAFITTATMNVPEWASDAFVDNEI
jgi:hypothetical protein